MPMDDNKLRESFTRCLVATMDYYQMLIEDHQKTIAKLNAEVTTLRGVVEGWGHEASG